LNISNQDLLNMIDLILGMVTGLVLLSLAGLFMEIRQEFKQYRDKGFNRRMAFKLIFKNVFY